MFHCYFQIVIPWYFVMGTPQVRWSFSFIFVCNSNDLKVGGLSFGILKFRRCQGCYNSPRTSPDVCAAACFSACCLCAARIALFGPGS